MKNKRKSKINVNSEEKKRFIWFGILALILILILIFFLIRSNVFVNAAKRYVRKEAKEITEKTIIEAKELKDKGYNPGLKKECLEESYVEITKDDKDKLIYKTETICNDTKPVIKLIGKKTTEMFVNNEYIDPGVIATLGKKDISNRIKIDTSNIDNKKAGTYEVIYSIEDRNGNKAVLSRKVNVIDNLAPVITLKGNNTTYVYQNQKYIEKGYTAIDNDGTNLTNDVEVKGTVNNKRLGYYYITYSVSDYAGNITTKTRTVKVIQVPDATITLRSGSPYYHTVNTTYNDPGYTSYDVIKGDITKNVKVTGTVDTTTLGDYEITYEVTGTNGKLITIKRIVKVVDNLAPVITLNGNEKQTLIKNFDTYTELGATALDNYDGDISASIITSGTVDDTTIGTYYITYTVEDSFGNIATKTREIEVIFKDHEEDTNINSNMITNEVTEGNFTTKKSSYEGTNVYYKYIVFDPLTISIEHKESGAWTPISFTYNSTDNCYEYIYDVSQFITDGALDEFKFKPLVDGSNGFIKKVYDKTTDDLISTNTLLINSTATLIMPISPITTTLMVLNIETSDFDNNIEKIEIIDPVEELKPLSEEPIIEEPSQEVKIEDQIEAILPKHEEEVINPKE